MFSHTTAALRALAVAVTLLAGSASAHEGHDHGAPPPPVSKTIAPRAEASSSAFELVVVPKNGTLVLYLDRFATGEPVHGATLTVETPSGPIDATPGADSSYQVPGPWLTKPGRYDLMVTVSAGEDVDVLPVTLELPDPNAQAAPTLAPTSTTQALVAAISQTTPTVIQGLKTRLIERRDLNRPGFPGGRLVWVRRPRLGARPRHSSALRPRREARCRSVRAGGDC